MSKDEIKFFLSLLCIDLLIFFPFLLSIHYNPCYLLLYIIVIPICFMALMRKENDEA